MAFQSRFRKRTPFRRKFTGRRPSRPRLWSVIDRKANKRYQWVPLYSDVCTTRQLSPRFCYLEPEGGDLYPGSTMDQAGNLLVESEAPEFLSLVEPAALPVASLGVDSATDNTLTIARMRGSILLYPFFYVDAEMQAFIASQPSEGLKSAALATLLGSKNYFFRAGLSKDRFLAQRDQNAPEETFLEAPVRDPLIDDQWTDGQFMKRWQRSFGGGYGGKNIVSYQETGSAIGVCSNVSGGGGGASAAANGVTWTGTEGAINTQIDDIETTCQVVTTTGNTAATVVYQGIETQPAPLIRLSFNSRRRLVFKENEGLSLWLNYTSYNENGTYITGLQGHHLAVGFLMRRSIEALLEET